MFSSLTFSLLTALLFNQVSAKIDTLPAFDNVAVLQSRYGNKLLTLRAISPNIGSDPKFFAKNGSKLGLGGSQNPNWKIKKDSANFYYLENVAGGKLIRDTRGHLMLGDTQRVLHIKLKKVTPFVKEHPRYYICVRLSGQDHCISAATAMHTAEKDKWTAFAIQADQ